MYAKVFETIDQEEDTMGNSKTKRTSKAPPFGDSTTPYEEVKRFYTYWLNFVTRKSFAWEGQYNLAVVRSYLIVFFFWFGCCEGTNVVVIVVSFLFLFLLRDLCRRRIGR